MILGKNTSSGLAAFHFYFFPEFCILYFISALLNITVSMVVKNLKIFRESKCLGYQQNG